MEIGQYAVHSNHGLIKIKRSELKTIAGKSAEFLVCEVSAGTQKGLTLMLKKDDRHTSVRPLASASEIKEVFAILKQPAQVQESTWNHRYRVYSAIISTGDLKQIAAVHRDLRSLQKVNDLSFGERKMMDATTAKLSSEIAQVLEVSREQAEAMVLRVSL